MDLRPLLLVAFVPLLVAWQGSGSSRAALRGGELGGGPGDPVPEAEPASAEVVARIGDGVTRLVALLRIPGERDAVLSLRLDSDGPLSPAWRLPHVNASAVYEELNADGDTLFLSKAPSGTVETVFRASGSVTLTLDLVFEDPDANRWVRYSDLSLTLVPDVTAPEEEQAEAAPAGGSVTASGGCEDHTYRDPGTRNHVWEAESTPPDDSGGCDSSSSSSETETASDSGGCEGDDVSSDTSEDAGSCADSCDGDAAAAARPEKSRRALLTAKLVAWLPYLIVLVPLSPLRRLARVARRRKFRYE